MKAEIRLATQQFCYISFFLEGTPEDIIAEEKRIQKLYQGGEGLSQKEFNSFLDDYLATYDGESTYTDNFNPDQYSKMSNDQKLIINEIKKSKKRKHD